MRGEARLVNVLFVCSRNRLRSPTAEAVFASWPGIETDSAGLSPDAEVELSLDQVEWADIIFVMERRHKAKLTQRFGRHLGDKRVVCLDIPDKYGFMDAELVARLGRSVAPLLRRNDLKP